MPLCANTSVAALRRPLVLLAKSIALPLGLSLVVAGCRPSTPSLPPATTARAATFVAPGTDPWKLTWTDYKSASYPVLWNGLVGIRIGKNGLTTDKDNKPLPMFLIDEYDTKGSESIRKINNPLMFAIDMDDSVSGKSAGQEWRNPIPDKNWSQSIDFRTGIVETKYDLIRGGHVNTQAVVDPLTRQIAYRVKVSGKDLGGFHAFGLRGDESYSPNEPHTLWTHYDDSGMNWTGVFGPSKTPAALHLVMPKIYEDSWDSGGDWDGIGAKNSEYVFDQTMSLAASPNLQVMNPGVKYTTTEWKTPEPLSFDEIAKRSADAWDKEWKTDIEIDGPVEDQQAVRSFMFYLRSAVSPEGSMSISPMGLSSDVYQGHVFWDADMWVLPTLAFIDPDRAKMIPQYRIKHEMDSLKNYNSWLSAGGPTADLKYKRPMLVAGTLPIGLKYPWESSVTGSETTTGPSRFEDHVSGSVAFSLDQAVSLGLADKTKASEIIGYASNFYDQRAEESKEKKYEIKSVMSPDENHVGDNDLYTNLLAQWCEYSGGWEPDLSQVVFSDVKQPRTFYLPKDDKSFLTYDHDPVKAYKQAAAILSIYPLQYPPAEAQAKVMMDRFADKVIDNGPAMSKSIDAVIWARLGETDKAYDAWRHGWMDYVYPPFLLFSEKKSQDRTYFTTGAAGELQSVIYGFLGFRIDSKPEAGASWSLKLKGDRWLSIKPNLPKEWKRVTFRNFHVLGKTYTLTATHDSVQVSQGD